MEYWHHPALIAETQAHGDQVAMHLRHGGVRGSTVQKYTAPQRYALAMSCIDTCDGTVGDDGWDLLTQNSSSS
jgi:hypothetical protein